MMRGSIYTELLMWGWGCAKYFVIASCGLMHIDNSCMYMAHVCFKSVNCSDCGGA